MPYEILHLRRPGKVSIFFKAFGVASLSLMRTMQTNRRRGKFTIKLSNPRVIAFLNLFYDVRNHANGTVSILLRKHNRG